MNTTTLEPPPIAAVQTPASTKKPLKRVSFSKAPAKAEDTTSEYPIMPDPTGEIAEIVTRILDRKATMEALEGSLETDVGELKMKTAHHYYRVTHGRSVIPSGISALSNDGKETVILFTKRLTKPKGRDKKVVKSEVYEAMLAPILGDRLPEFFQQAYNLKVDGAALPADTAQIIVDEIIELLAKHGQQASDALTISESLECTADFHVARHTQLTVEQNLALEQICPIVAQCKTKGRGKS